MALSPDPGIDIVGRTGAVHDTGTLTFAIVGDHRNHETAILQEAILEI
jgi:hypothetical protein